MAKAKKQVTFSQALITVMDWRDVAVRATKTAIQTFVAIVPVDTLMSGNPDILKSAIVAAVSAGLSVVWNALALWSSSNTSN